MCLLTIRSSRLVHPLCFSGIWTHQHCNGTRLAAKKLMPHVSEATFMTGHAAGKDVFIPCIAITPSDLPFQFRRLQFHIYLSFAMSINKAQGQSLKVVGLNLQSPCFSHGQLYVGCSRVGNGKNLVSSWLRMEKHETLSVLKLYKD